MLTSNSACCTAYSSSASESCIKQLNNSHIKHTPRQNTDIYKNQPRIISHTQSDNNSSYIGTEIQVLISGNWTTYKSRVVQYLQQLAIITPYAKLEMSYNNRSDAKKEMNLRFDRRSEQMPPQAREVKYHPSSVSLIQANIVQSRGCTFLFNSYTILFLRQHPGEQPFDSTITRTNQGQDPLQIPNYRPIRNHSHKRQKVT